MSKEATSKEPRRSGARSSLPASAQCCCGRLMWYFKTSDVDPFSKQISRELRRDSKQSSRRQLYNPLAQCIHNHVPPPHPRSIAIAATPITVPYVETASDFR